MSAFCVFGTVVASSDWKLSQHQKCIWQNNCLDVSLWVWQAVSVHTLTAEMCVSFEVAWCSFQTQKSAADGSLKSSLKDTCWWCVRRHAPCRACTHAVRTARQDPSQPLPGSLWLRTVRECMWTDAVPLWTIKDVMHAKIAQSTPKHEGGLRVTILCSWLT